MFLSDYLRPLAIAACLALLIAPIVGFSHAVVAHTHAHAHDQALHMELWEGLHSALTRKDLGVAILPALFILFALVPISRGVHTVSTSGGVREALHTAALRRGIVAYRRFG